MANQSGQRRLWETWCMKTRNSVAVEAPKEKRVLIRYLETNTTGGRVNMQGVRKERKKERGCRKKKRGRGLLSALGCSSVLHPELHPRCFSKALYKTYKHLIVLSLFLSMVHLSAFHQLRILLYSLLFASTCVLAPPSFFIPIQNTHVQVCWEWSQAWSLMTRSPFPRTQTAVGCQRTRGYWPAVQGGLYCPNPRHMWTNGSRWTWLRRNSCADWSSREGSTVRTRSLWRSFVWATATTAQTGRWSWRPTATSRRWGEKWLGHIGHIP